VVNDVADNDIRDFPDGATRLGVFVSAARVPAIRLDDMDFTGNMAEAKSSTRDDGNGVGVVVDTPEVVHLGVRIQSGVQEKWGSREVYLQVEVFSEGGYTNSRSSIGDTPHSNIGRKVQPKEEGVKLSKGSPE